MSSATGLYLAVCITQTHNGMRVVFKDHPPEVHHCAAEWCLAHDELLAVVVSLFVEGKKKKKEANAAALQFFASKVKKKGFFLWCLTVT